MRSCTIIGHPLGRYLPFSSMGVDNEKPFDFACLLYELDFRVFHTSLVGVVDRMMAYSLVRMNMILKDIALVIIKSSRDASEELAEETTRFVKKYGVQQCESLEQALCESSCLFLIDCAEPHAAYAGKTIHLTQQELNDLSEETIQRIKREISVDDGPSRKNS